MQEGREWHFNLKLLPYFREIKHESERLLLHLCVGGDC